MEANRPAAPERVLALKTPPFPDRYADPCSTDPKLDDALATAIAAGPGKTWRVAFAIVALDPDGRRPMAHVRGKTSSTTPPETLVDAASSQEMLAYLHRAVTYQHEVWIDRTVEDGSPQGGLDASEFTVTHNKLGVGPLKTSASVYYEASILQHNATGRRFVVVWANLLLDDTIWAPVAQVIRRTIRGYLGLTP